MNDTTIILLFLSLILLVLGYMYNDYRKAERKRLADRENDILSYFQNAKNNGVNIDIKYETKNKITGIDKNREKLILIDMSNTKNISSKSIDFKDIISCELMMDGTTIYKKSTTRSIGGALIGGVLAGGVGAVVGGLSGNSKEKKEIKRIDLKVVVRDLENPYVVINFLNSDMGLDESCPTFQNCRKNAEEGRDRLSVIIAMEDNKAD